MVDPATPHRAEQAPPLDGVTILDLTRLLPGAYATLLLADLGADVIKIEDPRGGDGMRSLAAGSYFDMLNRNKKSVTLDLRSPDAAPVLDALAARSDVIVDSFRPSTARRLGVDPDSIRMRHRRLVCASINGFGRSGPDAERAAHDINYQALAGLLRAPTPPGPLVGDIGAAMHAAIGILAALLRRERTGEGSSVDVPIARAALDWSMFPTTGDLEEACYTIYETADNKWLALGALEAKFWTRFCERLGRSDLIALQHAEGRERMRVMDEVRAIMRSHTEREWLALFGDADVCLTPVLAPEDVTIEARGIAPVLGAHTDDVLAAAGISQGERERLRRRQVI
ncbi:MAG: carnitine dehydratase [Acidobacteria bacterium]|nr:MAG: carnitine dehydratase [Acidobacteriota bacterium]